MVGDSKLINIPHQALDSHYVEDTQSVDDTCYEDIDFQINSSPNDTDSFPLLKSN